GPNRLQPVDAVRGIPSLHGGREGSPPTRRTAPVLASRSPWQRTGMGRRDDAHEDPEKEREWGAEIRERVSDERVIWQSTSGEPNAGLVRFDPLAEDPTRAHRQLHYEAARARAEM